MSSRSSSGENRRESVELTGLAPLKIKNVNDVKKSDKIDGENAISLLGSGMRLLIAIMEEPFDKAKSKKYIKKTTGLKNDKTIDTWLGRLEKAGIISETPEGWVVSCSKFMTSEVIEAFTRANTRKKVSAALKELSAEKYVHITLYDVSHKILLAPRLIEDDVHLLAPSHGLTVAAESSWNYELSEGEHLLDVIAAHSLRKELSQVDPKSRIK